MTLRLLIFGQSGQVATELLRRVGPGLTVQALSRAEADLADPAACAARVAAAEADVVVNAAAWTSVDGAEVDEVAATVVNAGAPAAMAQAAARRGLPFLHVSTDYVFDGVADRPRREDDLAAPLNAYGRSKLAGERAVETAGGPYAILRTAWVHAGHGANFVRAMLSNTNRPGGLRVVDDQFGDPTPAGALAEALIEIAHAFARGRGVSGTFHFAGMPTTSWRCFAEAVFAEAVAAKLITRAPKVAPIASADWPTPAVRPQRSALDCGKIMATYGLVRPDWRASLPGIVAEAAAGLNLSKHKET